MSSETSTDRGGFQAWHFFVLAALLAATAAVFLARQTSAINVVLLTVSVWAAGLTGLAVHRTLAPLTEVDTDVSLAVGGRTRAAMEREKTLVLRSIKELEFDRAMGKVSDEDFVDMVGGLRSRAMSLIVQLDAGEEGGYLDLIERELRARLASLPDGGAVEPVPGSRGSNGPEPAPAPEVREAGFTAVVIRTACSVCETANESDARFCKQCGQPLEVAVAGSENAEDDHA